MTSPSKLTLYDIGIVGSQINDYLELTEGEISPEAEEIFDRLLREGPERLEAAAAVLRQLDAYQEECKAEEKRLKARRESFEANAAKLKERIGFALDGAFGGKLKTSQVTLWMQQSPDTTAVDLKEGITPLDLYGERPDLVRVKYELDKVAVKSALDRGDEVPESIFVEHNTGRRSLRMK
jgi:hypothetical protein